MTLPPLPAAAYVYKKHHDPVYDAIYFTAEQMRKYGQQCREAALEEAACICDAIQKANEDTGSYMWEARNSAIAIRSLK